MAKVSRQSVNEMMAEQRTQYAAFQASGEVTPAVAALFETFLCTQQMLVLATYYTQIQSGLNLC